MIKTKKISIIESLFCFIVLVGTFLSLPVFAYQIEKYDDKIENRFIVTPPKFDFQIESGQSVETDFTVVNRLGRDEEFKIVVEELTDFDNSKKSFSATSWVEPEVNSFSLSQGERITQKLKITAPNNIPSGGYYAVIAVLVEGEGEGASGKIKLISQAGISLLTTVPGNLREDLSILRAQRVEAEEGDFGEVEVAGIKIGENSSGKGIIWTGERETVVESELVKNNSVIHLTLTSKKNGQDIYIKKIIEGENFVVEVEEGVALGNLEFNWLIIN